MKTSLIVAATIGAALAAHAAPITTLFNTGVDSLGVTLANGTVGDPHYSLASVPGGTTTTLIRTSVGGFPIPPYLGDTTTSAWIGPNNDPSLTSPNGLYIYKTTFDLTGFDPSTASIFGGWSSDNDGLKIMINGVDSGNPSTSFTQFNTGYAPFSITGDFIAGLNTLEFYVNNGSAPGDGGPTALRVEMTGSADLVQTVVPEAGASPALMVGALGCLFLYRRRNQK